MSKHNMMGLLYINGIGCSLLNDYHLYYYNLLTENIELCVVLLVISFSVLLIGRMSSFASMVPMVTMILKYANLKLSQGIKDSGFLNYLLGDNIDKVQKALENLDKFTLAIPLISILVTYLLVGLIEVTFFVVSLFILYIIADFMGLSFKTDIYLITIAAITLLIIGMMLMYVLRKIKDILIVSTCCYYFSVVLLTCLEIVGYNHLSMKNYFSDDTNKPGPFTPTEFLIILMTFSSIFFQYILCPALSSIKSSKSNEPVRNSYKVEPSDSKIENLHLENVILKERLERIERLMDSQRNAEPSKRPQNE